MKDFFKSHYDAMFAAGGLFATLTMSQVNVFVAFFIGICTATFVGCKAGIWLLKFRMAWRNRNNTQFWQRKSDEEETET